MGSISGVPPLMPRNTVSPSVSLPKDDLKKASQEFESLFLQQLLTQMRQTVPETDLFGSRRSEKVFESMLDERLAEDLAKAGGIGLGTILYEQLQHLVPDKEDRSR